MINIPSLVFFLATMSHNMTPREGFTLFGLFLNYYACFEFFEFLTMVEPACMKIGDEHRYNLHWISEETTYCESKKNFFKKSWAIDHIPVVQTGPTSCRFGRHLSFLPGMDEKV